MGTFTGTVPEFAAGEELPASKLRTMGDVSHALVDAASTWTPTFANLTVGNATLTGRYRQLGKWVDWYMQIVLGSTSSMGSAPTFTVPVTPAGHYSISNTAAFPGSVHLLQPLVTDRQGNLKLGSGSDLLIGYWTSTPSNGTITPTVPWTWATGHIITAWGSYEAA